MVFQKKENTSMKTKKFQQKKSKKIPQQIADSADLGDSMDDDDSGDSEEQIQTTSFNKTPKRKNEKRVSFKVAEGDSAVKATPAKTPKRNSLVPKKSLTPAAKSKGSMQQAFKGKQTKRPAQDDDYDDDEDDDDEEDNDFDKQGLDMDDSDAEDDDDDEGDMDEEDDDEDDMDEEEDNDSEEEEQHTKKNGKSVNVKLEKQKNAKQSKQLATPKAESSNDSKKAKQEKGSPAKVRDERNLFVGGLPKDVTVEELREMCPDIQNVFLPPACKLKRRVKFSYAFLQFESEAKAEANYKILQTKRFRGQPLYVDYAGEKSQRFKDIKPDKKYDMKKLHVSSLPVDTTIAQIAEYFPKAEFISVNDSKVSAIIGYATETNAADDFNKAKDVDIDGQKVIVQYALITIANSQRGK